MGEESAGEDVLRLARLLAEHPLARVERIGETNGRSYVAFRDIRTDEVRYAFRDEDVGEWLATVDPHEAEAAAAAASAEPSLRNRLERVGEIVDDAIAGDEEAITRTGITLLRWIIVFALAVLAFRVIVSIAR